MSGDYHVCVHFFYVKNYINGWMKEQRQSISDDQDTQGCLRSSFEKLKASCSK